MTGARDGAPGSRTCPAGSCVRCTGPGTPRRLLSFRPSASPAHPLHDAGSCAPLPGPEARLGLFHPGVICVPCAPRTTGTTCLPENVSPAAVSKSPAKVTRQVPSVLMVLSARRAASGRRRPVDAGSRGGREPEPQLPV